MERDYTRGNDRRQGIEPGSKDVNNNGRWNDFQTGYNDMMLAGYQEKLTRIL